MRERLRKTRGRAISMNGVLWWAELTGFETMNSVYCEAYGRIQYNQQLKKPIEGLVSCEKYYFCQVISNSWTNRSCESNLLNEPSDNLDVNWFSLDAQWNREVSKEKKIDGGNVVIFIGTVGISK